MKKLMLLSLLLFLAPIVYGATLGDHLNLEFLSGDVTINTTIITGTNISCSNVIAGYDVCTGNLSGIGDGFWPINGTTLINNSGTLTVNDSWVTSKVSGVGDGFWPINSTTLTNNSGTLTINQTWLDLLFVPYFRANQNLNLNQQNLTNVSSIFANDWSNVSITENQVSDLVHTTYLNTSFDLSQIPNTENVDLGNWNFTVNESTLFVDSSNNRVGIGQITGFDPRAGLSITGDVDITHTAIEADDHAFEIDVFASGFGDVKGIDVDYVTGAISTGSEEDVILINIDESLATGGDVLGVHVLATEGSARIYGLGVGVLVSPIVQFSGTFGDMDSINNSGVDDLANFTTSVNNSRIFVNDNDYIIIGDAAKFEEMEFLLNISASGAGIKPTFEYSTGVGTWGTFTPTDGTNGMRNTGLIEWFDSAIPTWATGVGTEYLIRINRTQNSLSTTPIESKVQIAAVTVYQWNSTGDITVNSIGGDGSRLTGVTGGTNAHTLNGSNHTGNLSSNRIVKDSGTNWLGRLLDYILDDLWDRDVAINSTVNGLVGRVNDINSSVESMENISLSGNNIWIGTNNFTGEVYLDNVLNISTNGTNAFFINIQTGNRLII